MASIRKRGKRWLAEVRIKGSYSSKSFDSKIEAQSWAVGHEQMLGKHGGLVKGKTLADAFERYANEVSPTKKGERWEHIRLKKLGRADMANILLLDLKTDDIQDYVTSELKRIKSSSVNRDLNLLSAVIEAARKQWKWVNHNPIRDVDRPTNPCPRDRRISQNEMDRILDALGYNEDEAIHTQRQTIAVAFLLAIETAMRQGEIFNLDWQHIDLEQQFATLPETKNGTKRDVPLSSRAIVLLKKLSPKEHGKVFVYNQASCGTIFRRALTLAEIKGMTFHDTRHEALTRLARKLEVLDLARMVGHRDPRSLMIYYNATASEIAQRLD